MELIEADARYVAGSGAVDSYMKSKDGYRGRWPDASFDIDGLGKFAIEVQFAPSLAPEVIGRSDFYAKEGVNLIWLLPWYSFEQVQRAYASDIAQEARGNFFVLDQEAERESRVRGTLVIWAAWIGERSFERKLVSLDDLTYPKGGHPFFVDAVTPAIFRTAERRRQQISLDLLETKDDIVPKRKVIFDLDEQPDEEGSRLIRSAISIWSAAKGEYINYSGHSDKLTGQIDAYLNSNDGRRRAVIINQMLVSTQARPCIKRSVWEKIERADLHDQLDDSDRWVAYVHSLFPEVFRVDLRSEALVAGSLPTWAIPAG
ncbi:competence protein CoiA family protein [Gemmobacter serpentinus]|uniref:hypothetical protein n=1 Tax=Gemmobacter serpentinus TaxID=2652247 RepID=UPI00124F0279|nr:hypothetical protein [Gemmobacter serpentinus]